MLCSQPCNTAELYLTYNANQGLKYCKIDNQVLRFYNTNWKGKDAF
jgi:hypothetical protein